MQKPFCFYIIAVLIYKYSCAYALPIQNCDESISDLRKELLDKIDVLNKKISSIEDYSQQRTLDRRSTGTVIAFHAYLSHSVASLGAHHTIPFDNEMTDSGDGYNQYISTYTVPETGIYVFSWTITLKFTVCATELILNAEVIGESYPDSEHDADNASATELVIREVNAGDVVFVRAKWGCAALRSDDVIRSSFSGWKL